MIARSENTKDYTRMSTDHLMDQNLSLKAKGLLSLILSLPDGELKNCSLKGLAALSRDSVDSVRTALKELIEYGYVETFRVRDEKGRLGAAEYVIYEKSFSCESEGEETVKKEK